MGQVVGHRALAGRQDVDERDHRKGREEIERAAINADGDQRDCEDE